MAAQDKTVTLTERQVFSSQHYIDNASPDIFANLDVDVTTECEETREDCVKIDLGDERYEIYPATKARVIVKHFYEQTPPDDSGRVAVMANSEVKPSITVTSTNHAAYESPDDRTVKERAQKLMEYERTTDDPEFWEAVEWARKAKEHVVFELPRGVKLDIDKRRALESLLECLVADDVTGALQSMAGFTEGKNTKRKPKRFSKLFGKFAVHDRG